MNGKWDDGMVYTLYLTFQITPEQGEIRDGIYHKGVLPLCEEEEY